MNSALQCLSNIDVLRDYFLKEHFKADVNMVSKDGSKGEVVTRFAEVLHHIWNSNLKELNPKRLWIAIGRANGMFKEP